VKQKKYTYFFNATIAREAAKQDKNAKNIYFYDGEKIDSTPKYCINVPIEEFSEFFLHSGVPYPNELNFDGLDISQNIQEQITNNIIHTIDSIKTQALEKLNLLLMQDITSQNITTIIEAMLTHIYVNHFLVTEIPSALIKKILEVAVYVVKNSISLNMQIDTNLYKIQDSMFALHMRYALNIFNTSNKEFTPCIERYFKELAAFENVEAMSTDFLLITILYPNEQLEIFLTKLGDALFTKKFWQQNITQQKHAVFKIHYMIMINYTINKAVSRKKFAILFKLFEQAIASKNEELLFYLYTPLLSSWGSVADTQGEFLFFNDTVERPLESFIKKQLIPKYNIKKNSRKIKSTSPIKIAFLQDRLLDNHSVNDVFYSLLKALQEYPDKKYEFTVYNLNFMDNGGSHPEQIEKVKQLGFKYVDLHQEYANDYYYLFYPSVKKALQVRQRVINDEIDVLIGLNTRPEYNFLFTSRTAPLQVYWSHGNYHYDIEGIDYKIKHSSSYVGTREISGFLYHEIGDPLDIEEFLSPTIDNSLRQSVINQLPKHNLILGTIGRMNKLNSLTYLQTICSCMEKHPQAIYLACGSGDTEAVEKNITELGYAQLLHRFVFPGHVDQHLYGSIIDIWPNTFPFPQGLSALEYSAKGGAMVTLANEFQNTDEQLKIAKEYNNEEEIQTICLTVQEYENSLEKLMNSEKLRQKLTQSSQQYVKDHYSTETTSSNFFHILDGLL